MYNDLLIDIEDNEYVHVIQGCLNTYISDKPAPDTPCAICGEYDWEICEGYVSDIKKANDLDQLYEIQCKRISNNDLAFIELLRSNNYKVGNVSFMAIPNPHSYEVDGVAFERMLNDRQNQIQKKEERLNQVLKRKKK